MSPPDPLEMPEPIANQEATEKEIRTGQEEVRAARRPTKEEQRVAKVREAAKERDITGDREEDALQKVGQRRINLIWEVTQATLAISVPGAALFTAVYIVIYGTPELQTAGFALLVGAMNLVMGFYFSRTNHSRQGGVWGESERRGE